MESLDLNSRTPRKRKCWSLEGYGPLVLRILLVPSKRRMVLVGFSSLYISMQLARPPSSSLDRDVRNGHSG